MFILYNILILMVLDMVEVVSGVFPRSEQGVLSQLYNLAILLPAIAVGVRRMHDVDKSGWFLLIPIYNLILACTDGTKGPNRFGVDPKEEERQGSTEGEGVSAHAKQCAHCNGVNPEDANVCTNCGAQMEG